MPEGGSRVKRRRWTPSRHRRRNAILDHLAWFLPEYAAVGIGAALIISMVLVAAFLVPAVGR